MSVCPSVVRRPPAVCPCFRKLAPIPVVVSQNVTNKNFLVYAMSVEYAFWIILRPQSDCCHRGEAEVRTFNFKTTWSEFQKPSQTATQRSEAELSVFNFKITWSEFQKHRQTAAQQGEAELRIFNFKTTWLSSRSQVRLLGPLGKLKQIYRQYVTLVFFTFQMMVLFITKRFSECRGNWLC